VPPTSRSRRFAVASSLQNSSRDCKSELGLCDPVCYNSYTHMVRWMNRTPEFQLLVVVISSPVALLVALWGMTPSHTLHHMQPASEGSGLLLTRETLLAASARSRV
jgi:hypothetical protein